LSQGMITSSAFRTYHTPLNSQPDFIHALAAARRFAGTASSELGLQVRCGGGPYVWEGGRLFVLGDELSVSVCHSHTSPYNEGSNAFVVP
jgi:hypothetical protein